MAWDRTRSPWRCQTISTWIIQLLPHKKHTDGTGFYTCKECHQTESLWNYITTDHKEEEQLEDRRNVGENNCNSGDGTDQRVQSLMFMMMMTSQKTLKSHYKDQTFNTLLDSQSCTGTKHLTTLCGQDAPFSSAPAGGACAPAVPASCIIHCRHRQGTLFSISIIPRQHTYCM
jgi:hypothetical protein